VHLAEVLEDDVLQQYDPDIIDVVEMEVCTRIHRQGAGKHRTSETNRKRDYSDDFDYFVFPD
jgi:hypothetical protein